MVLIASSVVLRAAQVGVKGRLVDATTEVYRAKNAYDFVKEKQVESLDALARVLQEATAVERAAELALNEHIRQHGCQR